MLNVTCSDSVGILVKHTYPCQTWRNNDLTKLGLHLSDQNSHGFQALQMVSTFSMPIDHSFVPVSFESSRPLALCVSRSIVSDSLWPQGPYSLWSFPGQNTGVGSHSLLQGFFPIQGLKPGLPHYRWILYQLSHHGSPRILKWVAYPFSSGPSWPRNQTRSLALQVDSLPAELPGKPF